MTADGEVETGDTVDAGESAAESAAGGRNDVGPRRFGWTARPRWSWRGFRAAIGVLVPLALIVRYGFLTPPSFDGGMNLQMAQNLSHGMREVRQFGGTVLFPGEIQTSGVYLYLAALLIKVFGPSTPVYELPNLLFLALLVITVSLALRRWPVLQVIGPAFVLLSVPGMVDNAMQGYGEYVVVALVFAAFALIGAASSGARRPVARCCGAAALVGMAITVKVVAVLALPVVVAGLVAVALARGELARIRIAASGLVLLVPVALVELRRLISLGSPSAYASYWSDQFGAIGEQAGLADPTQGSSVVADPPGGLLRKIATHVHLLAVQAGVDARLLILFLGLPFLVLIWLFLARRTSWRDWIAQPGAVLSAQLACYAGGYLLWWLAVTPTSKAWLRRVVIGVVAIAFLYLVLAGMVYDRRKRAQRGLGADSQRWFGADSGRRWFGGRSLPAGRALAAVAVLAACVALLPGLLTVGRQVRALLGADPADDAGITTLAAAARQLGDQGNRLYGVGWWSAPVVALYADRPLGNLLGAKPCDPANLIVTGRAYLIWDSDAGRIAGATPTSTLYDFVEVPGTTTSYGSIYRIDPKPALNCPGGR